jgi:hypothetical protein
LNFPIDLTALIFAVAVFAFSLFVLNQHFLFDPDTYWHVETGRWIWMNHAVPRSDIFSHTAHGHAWTNMEWLSQVILFLFYAALGFHGLVIVSSLAITVTFGLLYWLLAHRLRATVALGGAVVAMFFASLHFSARPHLLSYPIIVAWIAGLVRACDEKRAPSYWLLPLMTLWSNMHGAFTLGLLLAGGFGFEATVMAAAAERWHVARQWIVFWFCALGAGCITPYGYQYVMETYNVLNLGLVLEQNSEWQPMNAESQPVHEAILLVLLILALSYGAKLAFPRVLLVVGMLHLGLRHVRGLPMIALSWPFMLAGPLSAQFPFLRPTTDSSPLFGTRGLAVRGAAAILATTVVTVGLAVAYMRLRPDVVFSPDVSPRAAVDFALKSTNGPVFNDFNFGGYLIHRGIKTFIDGRTLPFGRNFAIDYFDAATIEHFGKLEELTDRYKVTWTLIRPNTILSYYFDHSPRWQRVYADEFAVVHVRR